MWKNLSPINGKIQAEEGWFYRYIHLHVVLRMGCGRTFNGNVEENPTKYIFLVTPGDIKVQIAIPHLKLLFFYSMWTATVALQVYTAVEISQKVISLENKEETNQSDL